MRFILIVLLICTGCDFVEAEVHRRAIQLETLGYTVVAEARGSQQICGPDDDIRPVRVIVTCNAMNKSVVLCCDTISGEKCTGIYDQSRRTLLAIPKCDEVKLTPDPGTARDLERSHGREWYGDDRTNPWVSPCRTADDTNCWVLPGGFRSVRRGSIPECTGDLEWYSDCWMGDK